MCTFFGMLVNELTDTTKKSISTNLHIEAVRYSMYFVITWYYLHYESNKGKFNLNGSLELTLNIL